MKMQQPSAEQVRALCAAMTDQSVMAAESKGCDCKRQRAFVRLSGGRTASGEVYEMNDRYVSLITGGRTIIIPYHSIMYISLQ